MPAQWSANKDMREVFRSEGFFFFRKSEIKFIYSVPQNTGNRGLLFSAKYIND